MGNYKIKDLPKPERPREKLISKGSENLKDEELLAILLGTGLIYKYKRRGSGPSEISIKKEAVRVAAPYVHRTTERGSSPTAGVEKATSF